MTGPDRCRKHQDSHFGEIRIPSALLPDHSEP
jgi:hypothetical protein